jgi:hypothetical protein
MSLCFHEIFSFKIEEILWEKCRFVNVIMLLQKMYEPIMEKHRCEIKRYGSQGNEPCVLTGIVKKAKQVYSKKALFI